MLVFLFIYCLLIILLLPYIMVNKDYQLNRDLGSPANIPACRCKVLFFLHTSAGAGESSCPAISGC